MILLIINIDDNYTNNDNDINGRSCNDNDTAQKKWIYNDNNLVVMTITVVLTVMISVNDGTK